MWQLGGQDPSAPFTSSIRHPLLQPLPSPLPSWSYSRAVSPTPIKGQTTETLDFSLSAAGRLRLVILLRPQSHPFKYRCPGWKCGKCKGRRDRPAVSLALSVAGFASASQFSGVGLQCQHLARGGATTLQTLPSRSLQQFELLPA